MKQWWEGVDPETLAPGARRATPLHLDKAHGVSSLAFPRLCACFRSRSRIHGPSGRAQTQPDQTPRLCPLGLMSPATVCHALGPNFI